MSNELPSSKDDLERYARGAAALLGLEVHEADWPAVLANLEAIAGVASVLLAEPLPDDRAPAPVFEASK